MTALLLDREELAWAAGFFDGEGYVGIVAHNVQRRKGISNYKRVTLTIVQTDRRVLDRFATILPTRLSVRGPYNLKGNRNPTWQLAGNGLSTVQQVLCLLWTWLSPVKRLQFAEVVKQFCAYTLTKATTRRRGHQVLCEADVRSIRASEASHKSLSAHYGVGVNAIRRIRNGTRWAKCA